MKECGIGTPATRASIIERFQVRPWNAARVACPHRKGLALYSVVKAMRIAHVAMTGEWKGI